MAKTNLASMSVDKLLKLRGDIEKSSQQQSQRIEKAAFELGRRNPVLSENPVRFGSRIVG